MGGTRDGRYGGRREPGWYRPPRRVPSDRARGADWRRAGRQRAGDARRAPARRAGADGPVDVVVVPVSGVAGRSAWARVGATSYTEVAPVGPADAERHAVAQLADPRVARRCCVPPRRCRPRATLAPPSLATEVAASLDGALGDETPVVVRCASTSRRSASPWRGALDARRFVVDLDDDVEALLEARASTTRRRPTAGSHAAWLPARRHGAWPRTSTRPRSPALRARRQVVTVPNSRAPAPGAPPPPARRPPAVRRQPHLRTQRRGRATCSCTTCSRAAAASVPDATVDVVGARARTAGRAGGVRRRHRARAVADVTPHYDAAPRGRRHRSAPARAPASRCSRRSPTDGRWWPRRRRSAGLDVADGRPAARGADPDGLAGTPPAAARARRPRLADRLVDAASATLHDQYVLDVVAPDGATGGAEPRRRRPTGERTSDRSPWTDSTCTRSTTVSSCSTPSPTACTTSTRPPTVVFSLCDGTRTTDELAELVRVGVGARHRAAADDVARVRRPAPRRGSAAIARDPVDGLERRLLWHTLHVDGRPAVRRRAPAAAPAGRAPDARACAHDALLGAAAPRRGLRGARGGRRLATVPDSATRPPTSVHVRAHRRAFELASLAGWARVHAATVDLDGVRVLVVGPSGAGKSTLARPAAPRRRRRAGRRERARAPRGASLAVPRAVHLKTGYATLAARARAARRRTCRWWVRSRCSTRRRLGRPWRLTRGPGRPRRAARPARPGPAGPESVEPETIAPARVEPVPGPVVLEALVQQAFPVAEGKADLVRTLVGATSGAAGHRVASGHPAATVDALRGLAG